MSRYLGTRAWRKLGYTLREGETSHKKHPEFNYALFELAQVTKIKFDPNRKKEIPFHRTFLGQGLKHPATHYNNGFN